MHLDAHANNFLVCECSTARNCTANRWRVVDLRGVKYWFHPTRRLYLIDFSFSHFLDDVPMDSLSSDIDQQLTSELFPAFDFINMLRATLPNVVSKFWCATTNLSIRLTPLTGLD